MNNVFSKTATLLELLSKAGLFVVSFLVARLFGAEALGVWNLVQTYLFFFLIVSEFSCHQNGVRLIIADGKDNEMTSVTGLAVTFYFKIAGFALSVIIATALFYLDVIDPLVFALVVVYCFGVLLNFDFYYRASGRFSVAALQNIIVVVLMAVGVLLGAHYDLEITTVVLFRVLLYITITLVASVVFVKRQVLFGLMSINKRKLFGLVGLNFKGFFLVLLGAVLARLVGSYSVFLIGIKFSPYELGLYSAISILYVGFITVRGVIVTQIYPTLCDLYDKGLYGEFCKKWTKLIVGISFLVLPVFFYFSQEIITILYGKEYVVPETVHMLRTFLLVFLVLGLGVLSTTYLHVARMSSEFFLVMLTASLLTVVSTNVLVANFSILGAAYAILMVEIFVVLLSLFLSVRRSRK